MRPLLVILFATVAIAMASTNQTQNTSVIPNDFLQGVNLGLGINVTSDALANCEGNYWMAIFMTEEFAKYLFIDWGVDFALIHGIFGMSYEGILHDWKKACEPVAIQYGDYFANAIYAYQTNKEAFLATVESNFNSNQIGIIETGISVVSLIKAGDYYVAGYEFAGILNILLSTWLPSESN